MERTIGLLPHEIYYNNAAISPAKALNLRKAWTLCYCLILELMRYSTSFKQALT